MRIFTRDIIRGIAQAQGWTPLYYVPLARHLNEVVMVQTDTRRMILKTIRTPLVSLPGCLASELVAENIVAQPVLSWQPGLADIRNIGRTVLGWLYGDADIPPEVLRLKQFAVDANGRAWCHDTETDTSLSHAIASGNYHNAHLVDILEFFDNLAQHASPRTGSEHRIAADVCRLAGEIHARAERVPQHVPEVADDVRLYLTALDYLLHLSPADCGLWLRASYERDEDRTFRANMAFIERVGESLPPLHDGRIIDLCSSCARLSAALAQSLGGARIDGLDREPFEQLLAHVLQSANVHGGDLWYNHTCAVLPQADILVIMSALHNAGGFSDPETCRWGTTQMLNAVRPAYIVGSDRRGFGERYVPFHAALQEAGAHLIDGVDIIDDRRGFVYNCTGIEYPVRSGVPGRFKLDE